VVASALWTIAFTPGSFQSLVSTDQSTISIPARFNRRRVVLLKAP
jgi:hypothetical protein